MDVITAAISSFRVARKRGRRIAEVDGAGVRFPPLPSLGFHVMLSGTGWLLTPDAPPAPLRPGDIVVVAAGAEHGIARVPGPLAGLPWVEMGDVTPPPGPAAFEFLCASYQMDGPMPVLFGRLTGAFAFTPDHDRWPGLRTAVDMLRADCTDRPPGTEASRAALIDLVMVHILRHLQEHGDQRFGPLTAEPGIAAVLREIHERPERPWTVDRLSGIAGMSRTAFTRRFRAAVGASPMAYLTDWRLATAARLLRESTVPLAAVARRVGYSTEFAFGAAFRRRYGIPPGRYRTAGSDASRAARMVR